MTRNVPGLVAALAVWVTAAQADSVYYHCVFPERQAIPAELFLEHDPDKGSVRVMDPYIKAFVGHPLDGSVASATDKRITFAWSFDATDKRGQGAIMSYRLSYFRADKTAQISATPKGYDNSWNAAGSCAEGTR